MSTFTTVGYGDYSGHGESIEIMYVMFLEIGGLAVFSVIIGSLLELESDKTAHMLVQEYVNKNEALLAEVAK